MSDLPLQPGTLSFQCNICGAQGQIALDALGRETRSCDTCLSTPRTRAIIRALSLRMFGESLALPEFPSNHAKCGLGLTDSEDYATRLVDKFDYQNTYLHQDPRFDIGEPVSAERMDSYDFLISSEVFEHVSPPVGRVFLHSFQLLKPGGILILTVPYGRIETTIEHFPDLHDYSLDLVDDRYVLTNVTREGSVQKFEDLLFHGGPGSTLEMRVFAERDLLAHLTAAGFTDLQVHSEPCFRSGIWWRQAWSLPISAQRPRSD